MTNFLAQLAKSLADKWLSVLVLPGLLLLGVASAGHVLDHRRFNDARQLVDTMNRHAAALAPSPSGLALLMIALLLAAAACGLLAQFVGWILGHLWTAQRLVPLTGTLTRLRQRRWIKANEKADTAETDKLAVAAAARRNRIALAMPQRPTWMGDRVAAVEVRVRGQYGLDLPTVWPRLWLLLPDTARNDVAAAQAAFERARALAGWGLLYLLTGIEWWPGILVGLVVTTTGWLRARSAVAVLADLTESTVDLHATALAAALGVPIPESVVTPQIGRTISAQIRKGA